MRGVHLDASDVALSEDNFNITTMVPRADVEMLGQRVFNAISIKSDEHDLSTSKNGAIVPTDLTMRYLITKLMSGVFGIDRSTGDILMRWGNGDWSEFRDDVELTMGLGWWQRVMGVHGNRLNIPTLRRAIRAVAEKNKVYMTREALSKLPVWDNMGRIEGFFTSYMGTRAGNENKREFLATAGKCLFVSLVARAIDPGCDVDFMLILVGHQGAGKSKAMRAIVGKQFFMDTTEKIGGKVFQSLIRGKMIVELGELASFRGLSDDEIKGFLTQSVDRYSPKYHRGEIENGRCGIFVGTTNRDDFIVDSTGSRRFLSVEAMDCDVERIERDREQLLAEAVALYRSGYPYWSEAEKAGKYSNVKYSASSADPWFDSISDYVDARVAGGEERTRIDTVYKTALTDGSGDIARVSNKDAKRIGRILKALGCENKVIWENGATKRYWLLPRGKII